MIIRVRQRQNEGAEADLRRRRRVVATEHNNSGAGLSFSDLLQSEPREAAPETHIPTIGRALLPDDGGLSSSYRLVDAHGVPSPPDALPPIHLFNETQEAGYSFVRQLKRLSHAEGWGEVWSGIRYTRTTTDTATTFKAPRPGEFVAIKKLNKRVVDRYLKGRQQATPAEALRHVDADYLADVVQVSGCENPYREMSRMQEFGDNVHVLRHIEFLQDDRHLYIVMPHACSRGSLDQAIFFGERLSVSEARDLFVQILQILRYLERHGIHHRDLSPDNFLFLEPHRLVVMDLAMSVRIPTVEDAESGGQPQRTLMRGMGRFGTPAFMAPEIYHNFTVFDGVAADLWSAVLILYAMLTRLPLYRRPDAAMDVSYRYYVVAGGIRHDQMNELLCEILADVFEDGNRQQQHILLQQATANLALPPDAQTLFHHVLRGNPAERWTLAQVLASNFCTRPQE